ncbi:MAG: DUF6655 family protein [Planctomycetaceae bacterium]
MSRAFNALVLLSILTVCGCSSLKRSDTARTGREQLLISNAIDQSLNKIDFQAFRGRAVLIEDKYLDCSDKGYLTASVRHRVARVGGTIATKPEQADIVLELRSGGVGTDHSDSFLGTPAIAMPGMVSIPEIKLISRSNQSAVAKIGLAAYDARTMQLLGEGGISLSQSADNNWFVFGVGPYQDGHVRREVERGATHQAGQQWSELPTQVAFAAPRQPGRVQVADGESRVDDQQVRPTHAVGHSTPIVE